MAKLTCYSATIEGRNYYGLMACSWLLHACF